MALFHPRSPLTAALPLVLLLAVSGCRREPAAPPATIAPASVLPAPAAPAAAEPNSFNEVAAQLDRGGSLYFYLSTEAWLAGLSEKIAWLRDAILPAAAGAQSPAELEKAARGFALLASLVKQSGLEEITGIGASSFAIEPGVHRNKFFVHHAPGKGAGLLWTALGGKAHPLDALDLLPADTALANFTDLDLAHVVAVLRAEIGKSGIPEAQQGLERALAQFQKTAGMPLEELLQSLGGSVGFIVTLDPTRQLQLPPAAGVAAIPEPRLALLFKVKDDRLFQLIEKTLGANPQVTRVDEPELRMRSVPLPPLLPGLALLPTVAQWGGYLIVASDQKLIRDIIAARQGGLRAAPAFAQLSAGLPTEGNSFQLVTQRFADTWNQFQGQMLKSQPAMPPAQAALMEKVMALQQAGPGYAVSMQLENGMLTVGKGSQGAGQMLAPLLIAPAAIAAGVAMPVFAEVQKRGEATKSLSNAKQIGLACKLYAMDHDGKFPPALAQLVPDYISDTAVFVSPFAPTEPIGYAYTAGLTETSPSATVLLEDKFAAKKGQRVIVRVDTTGAVTKAP